MGRILIHVAIIAALCFLTYVVWREGLFEISATCPACHGKGSFIMENDVGVYTPPCGTCAGRPPDPYVDRLGEALPCIALSLWELGCVGAALSLIWGLRTVNCRLCRGAGRLALEASPPGEASFRVDVDCVGCKGAGRLTVIDRWVYGFGWD